MTTSTQSTQTFSAEERKAILDEAERLRIAREEEFQAVRVAARAFADRQAAALRVRELAEAEAALAVFEQMKELLAGLSADTLARCGAAEGGGQFRLTVPSSLALPEMLDRAVQHATHRVEQLKAQLQPEAAEQEPEPEPEA